jgi:ankyrin repeat protein
LQSRCNRFAITLQSLYNRFAMSLKTLLNLATLQIYSIPFVLFALLRPLRYLKCLYFHIINFSTPLHPTLITSSPKITGCCIEGRTQILSYLIDKGADPNLCDVTGRSPLHFARSSPECITILLKAGALLNAGAKYNGQTTLWLASREGNLAIVQLLVQGGADTELGA